VYLGLSTGEVHEVIGYSASVNRGRVRDGVSLSAQEVKIEAYCLVKDWTLTEVIRNPVQSAKGLDRPGLQRLMYLVEVRQVVVNLALHDF
jgi:DNA invertase Pin-like site-specific DNA recombinase